MNFVYIKYIIYKNIVNSFKNKNGCINVIKLYVWYSCNTFNNRNYCYVLFME